MIFVCLLLRAEIWLELHCTSGVFMGHTPTQWEGGGSVNRATDGSICSALVPATARSSHSLFLSYSQTISIPSQTFQAVGYLVSRIYVLASPNHSIF